MTKPQRLHFPRWPASGITALLALGCSAKHMTITLDAGPTPNATDASDGGGATPSARGTADASTAHGSMTPDASRKPLDASPEPLDAPSLCDPLVCPEDGGCSKIVWPFHSDPLQCDPTGLGSAHGYLPATIDIGCGLVVVNSPEKVGSFQQAIYDETTGEFLGMRQNTFGTYTCEDSRPEVRRRTTHPVPAPTCASARICYPCSATGSAARPVYACQMLGSSQIFQWSPFDAD